ncbi:MAG: hypothetical protein LQ340_003516 [Diploschistes diacapsis]|nr:MAG: hypothetical protein LQ340_003516 [Diploschistes diacapsis]
MDMEFQNALSELCAADEHYSTELSALIHEGEFKVFSENTLDSVPYILQKCIKDQPSLRIDRGPISSFQNLVHVYTLLNRKQDQSEISSLDASDLAAKVVSRFYTQIWKYRDGIKEEFRALTIAGRESLRIVSRKCSKCGARLLDDAFARYKKLDQTKYVVRQLKMGCGSPGCNQKRILAIPFDESLKYCVPDINQLNRKPKETPGWEKHFVRTREDCLENEIPSTIETTCSKCHKEGEKNGPRITDENARWTIDKSPAYLLRKPKGCGKHKTAVFFPIDLSLFRTCTPQV